VIDFSGHGLAGELLLEGADRETDRVPTDELIRMLRQARDRLKLLVLSACESGAAASDPRPGNVADPKIRPQPGTSLEPAAVCAVGFPARSAGRVGCAVSWLGRRTVPRLRGRCVRW
jgi:hypothetical protein